MWFCGGHGVCLTQGDNSRVEARVVGWLRRRLMDDHVADSDPTFEWLADDGAQIVDERRHLVLGNQVTPIAIELDGLPHSVSRSPEGVAAAVEPGAHHTLQIAGGSSVYGPVRSAGTVALKAVRLSMPSVRR